MWLAQSTVKLAREPGSPTRSRCDGRLRRLQHRLHQDHHVEPNRMDLLLLPLRFLVPNQALWRRREIARAGGGGWRSRVRSAI